VGLGVWLSWLTSCFAWGGFGCPGLIFWLKLRLCGDRPPQGKTTGKHF